MGRQHPHLDADLTRWIGEQHLFFVASAPSAVDGHVNLSPKGYDTFRILGPTTVAYLDLTGSGIETVAHLRENGRLTIMFCAFEGKPRIVRLFGQGDVVLPGDDDWEDLRGAFPALAGERAIIRSRLDRIADSCGYSVPFLTYAGERDTLVDWAVRRGPDGIAAYHRERNAASIDGLDGLDGLRGDTRPDA